MLGVQQIDGRGRLEDADGQTAGVVHVLRPAAGSGVGDEGDAEIPDMGITFR